MSALLTLAGTFAVVACIAVLWCGVIYVIVRVAAETTRSRFVFLVLQMLFHSRISLIEGLTIITIANVAGQIQTERGIWWALGWWLVSMTVAFPALRFFEGCFIRAYAVEIQQGLVKRLNTIFQKEAP